uniref:Uncharacterized protein n=1 Tax=Meloidogyne incognita TaxID=6306 RepID=A0A914KKI6_MELIC
MKMDDVLSSSKQRERLRNHFIGALLKEDNLETILNKIAIEIIAFIRWIDIEIISQLEDVDPQKRCVNDQVLKDFRLNEVLIYKSDYDKIFNMTLVQLIEQRTKLNIRQFKLYKKLIVHENIKDLKLKTILDYMREKDKKIFISANESKEFLRWLQTIIANEFYEELGVNNKINIHERKNRRIFKEKISKGLSSSLSSRQRLYDLIGSENTRKCFELLKIRFDGSEFKNLEEIGNEYDEEREENNEKNSKDLIKNMDRMELVDAEDKNNIINNLVDRLNKLSLEESGSSKNIGNEIKNKENPFKIKNYSNSEILEDTEMVDLEQNEG